MFTVVTKRQGRGTGTPPALRAGAIPIPRSRALDVRSILPAVQAWMVPPSAGTGELGFPLKDYAAKLT
jgi:hypothetical protein